MTEADRIKAKRNAIAFKIWRYASEVEWNATIAEVAEAIGEPMPTVRGIVAGKGWSDRFRHGVAGYNKSGFLSKVWRESESVAQDIIAGRVGLAE